MITEYHLESDGERLLLRLVVDGHAALDVLTDRPTLLGADATLRGAVRRGLVEHRLGSFGPFGVVVSTTDARTVAIAVDGPDLGPAFRGDQSMVLYVDRSELLEVLARSMGAQAAERGVAGDEAAPPSSAV
jgi:hypothetical protein